MKRGVEMAKKKRKQKYYVVYSPEFKGIVESLKEYNKFVVSKKEAFGKSFRLKSEAEEYLAELIGVEGKRSQKIEKLYAVCGPLFTGVIHSKADYVKYVFGQKGMQGKQVHTVAEGEAWIRKRTKSKQPVKKEAAATVVSAPANTEIQKDHVDRKQPIEVLTIEENMAQQCVLYIDGGFKDGIGKYGLLAFASTKEQPILKDFGYVYDDSFNALMNTGAELMACLRGLEWAFVNGMKKVVIVYDYDGIIRLQKSMSEQRAVQMFTKQMAGFQAVMDVQFIHVRHSNRELHNAVHALTQLVV